MLTESPSIAPAFAVNDDRIHSPSYLSLLALFSLETLAINLVRLPESMRFDRFAFCDHGANLTLQNLIARGMRPSLDFGYHYGLLPALVGRIWFGCFGATPWSYQAAMVVADLLCVWAIARIFSQLKIRTVALALVIITLGYAFQATYVNFAHATEAVLISNALAEQARGSRINALAFATAAVFAKPSMGFVYGLLLAILIIRDLSKGGFSARGLIAALAPATLTLLALSTLFASIYGPRTLLHTILPIEGVSNYHALNFGFFAAGRGLWDPAAEPWITYLIDVRGFWIVSTVFLFAAALFHFCRNYHRTLAVRRVELLCSCAILHLAFLVLFFGNRWSWVYYSYVLMVGIAIAVDLGPVEHRLGLILCVFALFSCTDVAYWSNRWWHETSPDPATAGLWASADERKQWLRVLSTAHNHKTVILDCMGAAELLFPGFEEPVSLYLTRGLMQPEDIHRKLDQLTRAEVVVVPTIAMTTCSGVPEAPEFSDALTHFRLALSEPYFQVFQR
jgi:hypothetical protein